MYLCVLWREERNICSERELERESENGRKGDSETK